MNPNPEPSLQSVLPAATREAVTTSLNKDFRSTLKLPKGMNRFLVARGVDRMLLSGKPIEQVKKEMGITASEADYITKVVVEFKEWEMASKATTAVNTLDLSTTPTTTNTTAVEATL